MHRSISSAAALALALVATGCGHDECERGDLDCWLDHMMVYELELEGGHVKMTEVERSVLPPAGDPPKVSIVEPPTGSEYNDARTLMPLELVWASDCGQAPAICMHLCSDAVPTASSTCTRKARCSKSFPSGEKRGVFNAAIGYLAEPEQLREHFYLELSPVCAPGGADASALLKTHTAGAVAGPTVPVHQIIDSPDDPGGAVLPAVTTTSGSGGSGTAGSGGSGGGGGG
jgi:uncharacterized membrane protein YgcG